MSPFNPVHDRHVAQRNIFQIKVSSGKQFSLEFFAANLSPLLATSTIRLEPLTGESLQVFAKTLGMNFLPVSGGAMAVFANARYSDARPTIDITEHSVAAVFRESLEPTPQRFVRSSLARSLAALPVSRSDYAQDKQIEGRLNQSGYQIEASSTFTPIDRTLDLSTLFDTHTADILPNHELALTLAMAIPEKAILGTSFVYRAVEYVENRIAGGITFVVTVV